MTPPAGRRLRAPPPSRPCLPDGPRDTLACLLGPPATLGEGHPQKRSGKDKGSKRKRSSKEDKKRKKKRSKEAREAKPPAPKTLTHSEDFGKFGIIREVRGGGGAGLQSQLQLHSTVVPPAPLQIPLAASATGRRGQLVAHPGAAPPPPPPLPPPPTHTRGFPHAPAPGKPLMCSQVITGPALHPSAPPSSSCSVLRCALLPYPARTSLPRTP